MPAPTRLPATGPRTWFPVPPAGVTVHGPVRGSAHLPSPGALVPHAAWSRLATGIPRPIARRLSSLEGQGATNMAAPIKCPR